MNRFLLKSSKTCLSFGLTLGTVFAQSGSTPAALFREGVQAMQSGELAKAEENFRAVLVLDPKSAAAHINLGVAYMREKRWDEALTELRTAQSLQPQQPGIALNIGLAYYKKNDFASAIAPFAESLRLAPDSRQARYLLGLCYFFRSNYAKASETLGPLWDSERNNPNYLYVLSIAAGKANNEAFEKQAIDRLFTIGQSAPEFHLYIGKAWLAKGDNQKAIDEFKQAAAAKPTLPLVHYFLGRAYLQQHDYAKAEAEFLQDPSFAYSYEDLGRLYVLQQKNDKAAKAFEHAIQLNNTLVDSYVGLGKLYKKTGRPSDALNMVDHAVALAPNSASVHYARGQVLAQLHQAAAAHQEFDLSAKLLKQFNDELQTTGDQQADAQEAAQQ